jgi:hypothetical protein
MTGILMRGLREDQTMRLLDRKLMDENRPCGVHGSTRAQECSRHERKGAQ